MAHVMFGGLTHEPAIRLAERLADWTGLDHVFFADSGSVSVEVAIKMVLQYWHGERRTLLTVARRLPRRHVRRDGGVRPRRRDALDVAGTLAEHVFAPRPPAVWTTEWADEVRRLVARHAHELAGVIVEPVVQGAGGMRFHPPECVALLRELCDEHGLLLVLDEIATGFGRTGDAVRRRHASCADVAVRRQGADRRLHDARGDAVHGATSRSASTGR